jgi:hypothetical protein
MSILTVGRYSNFQSGIEAFEKTSFSYNHLMMSSVLKLAKSAVMATAR